MLFEDSGVLFSSPLITAGTRVCHIFVYGFGRHLYVLFTQMGCGQLSTILGLEIRQVAVLVGAHPGAMLLHS